MRKKWNIDYDRPYYAILTDERENPRLQDILKELTIRDLNFQIVENLDSDHFVETLAKQPVGCMLLVSVQSDLIDKVIHSAREANFSMRDVLVVSDAHQRVFCGSCHFINAPIEGSRFVCKNCMKEMEISDHFSAYYHAVLGYPVLQQTGDDHE